MGIFKVGMWMTLIVSGWLFGSSGDDALRQAREAVFAAIRSALPTSLEPEPAEPLDVRWAALSPGVPTLQPRASLRVVGLDPDACDVTLDHRIEATAVERDYGLSAKAHHVAVRCNREKIFAKWINFHAGKKKILAFEGGQAFSTR